MDRQLAKKMPSSVIPAFNIFIGEKQEARKKGQRGQFNRYSADEK